MLISALGTQVYITISSEKDFLSPHFVQQLLSFVFWVIAMLTEVI